MLQVLVTMWYDTLEKTQKDSKPEDKSKSKPPAISQSGSTKQLYKPQAKAKIPQ